MTTQITRFFDEETDTRLRTTIDHDTGDPLFVAQDVCRALGLNNTSQALAPLDHDEKGVTTVYTPGGSQDLLVVTEPGLYRLIRKSRKPAARRFERWIDHTVLPSIRKTGGYQAPNQMEDRARAQSVLMDSFKSLRDSATDPAERALMSSCLDHVVRQALTLAGGTPQAALPPAQRPLTVTEYAVEIYGQAVKAVKAVDNTLGSLASRLYRVRHGELPPKNDQVVKAGNGKNVSGVNVYEPEDFDLLEEACDRVFGGRP